MEIKKSSKADLEKGRGKRFLLALLLVLLMGYIAFQWKTEVVADSKIAKPDEEMFVPEADFPFAVELQPEPEIQPELTEHQDMDKIELTDDAEENRLFACSVYPRRLLQRIVYVGKGRLG